MMQYLFSNVMCKCTFLSSYVICVIVETTWSNKMCSLVWCSDISKPDVRCISKKPRMMLKYDVHIP